MSTFRYFAGPSTIVRVLTLFMAAACSSLAPGAEGVKVTRNPKDVAECKPMGQVSGLTGTQALPGAEKKMMNAAFALGGNVVFVTSTIGSYEGVAYRCPN
jgi:hypothetical protein